MKYGQIGDLPDEGVSHNAAIRKRTIVKYGEIDNVTVSMQKKDKEK